MEQIVNIIQVIVSVILVALVLVQQGKGAEVGASFGGGSSNTMFGSQGAMPFLMKVTVVLAIVFFATNLGLSRMLYHANKSESLTLTVPSSGASKPLVVPTSTPAKNTDKK